MQVVILDLDLPDAKGSHLLNTLKKRSSQHRIIVHTGHPELLKADSAVRLNVFKYLSKGSAQPGVSLGEPLKYAIEQAFQDINTRRLEDRVNAHLAVQRMINRAVVDLNVLTQICKDALRLVGGYTCHIRLLDLDKGDYELAGYAGPANGEALFRRNKRLNEQFSGRVAKLQRPQTYQDLQTDSDFLEFKADRIGSNISNEAKRYLDTIRSAYIIPIKTGLFDDKNQVDAVFNISSVDEAFFSAEKVRLVDDFATQVNLAISKKWLQERRDEIHNDYRRSNQLLVDISEYLQHADLNKVYEIVLTRVAEIIRPELVSLFLLDQSKGQLTKRAEFVRNQVHYSRDEAYAPGECLTGHVFSRGESLLINEDPTRHKYYSSQKEIDCLDLPSRRIEHYLGVPLISGNQVIGVLRAINKKSSYYDEAYPAVHGDRTCLLTRGFSRDCNVILRIIASHLAITLLNSALNEQLNSLAKVGQRISANYGLETENLLGLIVRETAEVMDAAVCMLFLTDSTNHKVVLRQSYPMPVIPDAYYRLGERNTGKVAESGQPVFMDATKGYSGKYDLQIGRFLRKYYGKVAQISSFMIVPIIIQDDSPARKDKVIGVLKLVNKRAYHGRFDANDLRRFQTFASQISVALAMSDRNRSLFKLVQGVGHEIENSVNLIVPDTSVSRRRVRNHAEELTKRNESFVRLLGTVSRKIERSLNRSAGNREVVRSLGTSFAPLRQHMKVSGLKDRKQFERLNKILLNISNAAEDARDFARDLLGFSDSRFRERKNLDINELIREEVNVIKSHPPPSVRNAKDVRVRFALTSQPILCKIFETPFRHVVRNIVANAYQAMEGKVPAELTLKTSIASSRDRRTKLARIEIVDTGKGIARADIPRLFDSDFTKRKGGNGLGLWLVKLALLRMDAAISVRSKLRKGTTFTVELPLAATTNRRRIRR